MKRILFFVSVLVCSLGFAQEFKFSKDLDPRNVTCIKKSGEYFTLLSEYDKYNKNYHITLFHLENDVNVLKEVYKTQDRLDLQSYHLYQNQLILVLFAQKKFNIDRYKGDDDIAKGHEIVTFNLDSNKVKNSSHSFKPDYKFSTDSKTYFLSFNNNNKIYLTTISDDQNIKTSDIEFTKEQRTSISLNIKDDLDVIGNDNFKENIGVKKSRIYYTDKAIYLTRDGYNFKKQSLIYKVSLADGMIKNLEEKSIEYPYGKAVKDLNSYLLNDKYYLITRYKSELNLQIASLDSIEKSVKNIYLKDYEDKAVWESGDVKRLVKKLTNIMASKVPSLMIYDLEGSDKKLVVVDDILKNTYYYDNFHWQFHQQMMQQQMMHQQMIQNAQQQMMQNMQRVQSMRMSMPGGFYMVELPLMTYNLETRDVKLKFLINGENEISRYNKEETSLKEYDYENALEKLKSKLMPNLKKYKSEFVSITFMGENKIQYAYFDKFEDRLLTGVLSLKED